MVGRKQPQLLQFRRDRDVVPVLSRESQLAVSGGEQLPLYHFVFCPVCALGVNPLAAVRS